MQQPGGLKRAGEEEERVERGITGERRGVTGRGRPGKSEALREPTGGSARGGGEKGGELRLNLAERKPGAWCRGEGTLSERQGDGGLQIRNPRVRRKRNYRVQDTLPRNHSHNHNHNQGMRARVRREDTLLGA